MLRNGISKIYSKKQSPKEKEDGNEKEKENNDNGNNNYGNSNDGNNSGDDNMPTKKPEDNIDFAYENILEFPLVNNEEQFISNQNQDMELEILLHEGIERLEHLFADQLLSNLAGWTFATFRENRLSEALNGEVKSRTAMDLNIEMDTKPDELLVKLLWRESQPRVMFQFLAADYASLFLNLHKLDGAPIVALLRDRAFKDNLPRHNKSIINDAGDAILAEKIVGKFKSSLDQLESQGRVLIFKDTASFLKPRVIGRYRLPNKGEEVLASYCISQALDLTGINQSVFAVNARNFSLYVVYFYEAAYLAAISQESKILILQSAFVENYFGEEFAEEVFELMLDGLLRVHKRLSPFLSANKIILATKYKTSQMEKLRSKLKESLTLLARQDAQVFISTLSDEEPIRLVNFNFDDVNPLTTETIFDESHRTPFITIEAQRQKDKIILEGWENSGLALSTYLDGRLLTGQQSAIFPAKLFMNQEKVKDGRVDIVSLNLKEIVVGDEHDEGVDTCIKGLSENQVTRDLSKSTDERITGGNNDNEGRFFGDSSEE